MIEATQAKARAAGPANVRTLLRDFVTHGTGLPDGSVTYAMLFNILHTENPLALLSEAWRILRPGGCAAVIHWNYDPSTPRGPDLAIRPKPEQCLEWTRLAGFQVAGSLLNLSPYHYGLVGHKPDS